MKRTPALILILLAAFVLATTVFYFGLTSRVHNAADFFIEWEGSRVAFGLDAVPGRDPYSDAATQLIQMGSKGHLVGPNEDQLAFVYPLYRVFYSAPLSPLPFDLAAAAWMAFSLVAYAWVVALLPGALGWRIGRRASVTLVYWAVALAAFPAFSALMLGQALLPVVAFLLGAYICLKSGRDGLAGALLALATVKPQLTLVIIPFALLWTAYHRRWRLWGGFTAMLGLLCAASFALMPGWVGAFLAGASRYPSYKPSLTGPGFLFAGLGLPVALGWLLWLLLAGAGAWVMWRARADERGLRFDAAFMVALVLTLWLPPQTNMSNATLLVGPFAFLMAYLATRRHRAALVMLAPIWIGLSWAMYSIFYTGSFNDKGYGWLLVGPGIVGLLTLALPLQAAFQSSLRVETSLYVADTQPVKVEA